MHAVSINQIADILHFNHNTFHMRKNWKKKKPEKSEKSSLRVIIFFTIFKNCCLQKFYKVAEKSTEK